MLALNQLIPAFIAICPIALLLPGCTYLQFLNKSRLLLIIPTLFLIILTAAAVWVYGLVVLLYILAGAFCLWSLLLVLSLNRKHLFYMAFIFLIIIPTMFSIGAELTGERMASVLFVLLVTVVIKDTLGNKVVL